MRAMPERPDAVAQARVSALVRQHHRSLLRVAQHWSANPEDAQDAVQRALEIYMRRLDSLDPATELSWLRVVVKHEAMAIRSRNADQIPADDLDEDERAGADQRPVDDLLAGRERVRRSKEALGRLKPDEAKALLLKAQGLSYAEIGESLGWTYTKVNRCMTEGRARFLKIYAELEAGETCEQFAPTLASLAAGTADADAMLDLRPHLRNCPACRATVRELHATRLGRLRVVWPLPALIAPLRWLGLGRGEPVTAPMPVTPDDDVLVPVPHLGPDDLEPVDMSKLYDAVEHIDPPTLDAAAEPGPLARAQVAPLRLVPPPLRHRRRHRHADQHRHGRRPHRHPRRDRRLLPQRPRRRDRLRGHRRHRAPALARAEGGAGPEAEAGAEAHARAEEVAEPRAEAPAPDRRDQGVDARFGAGAARTTQQARERPRDGDSGVTTA